MLAVVILSLIMLNFVALSAILPSSIVLIAVILSSNLLNFTVLSVVMLSVVMRRGAGKAAASRIFLYLLHEKKIICISHQKFVCWAGVFPGTQGG